MKTTQTYTNRRLHKQIVQYLHNGVQLSNKNMQTTIIHSSTDKAQKNFVEGKKTQKNTYCMIPFA